MPRINRQDRTSTEELAEFKLTFWQSIIITISLICIVVIMVMLIFIASLYLERNPESVYWVSTKVVAVIATPQLSTKTPYPTYTYYPTYTPQPTFTQVANHDPRWIWSELFYYHIPVEIPDDWNILPINHRFEPFEDQITMDECEDYLIIGPDGKQVIMINMPCGFAEGVGGPCEETDFTIVSQASEDQGIKSLIVRTTEESENRYIYYSVLYGIMTFTSPPYTGYWCMHPTLTTYSYMVLGMPYYDIADFSIPDRIMQSLLATNP
jgi:hypothetical protein